MKRILSLLFITAMMVQMIVVGSVVNAAETADIVVSSVQASAGDQNVEVTVSLTNSIDICGMRLSVSYPAGLTLTSVARGDALPSLTFTRQNAPYSSPLGILWDGLVGDTAAGTLVVLTFSVSENAQNGEYPITVSYSDGDIYDTDLNDISANITNGSITVVTSETAKDFDDIFTFEDSAVTYDGQPHSLAVSVSGTAPAGTTYSYSVKSATNAGTYKVTATISAPGYNDKKMTATLTINKKPISINIASVELAAGDVLPELGYDLDAGSLCGNDTLAGSPATDATGTTAGEFEITKGTLRVIDGVTGQTSNNYNVTYHNGVLTVNAVEVTAVELYVSSDEVKNGETIQILAAAQPSNATDQSLTWTSSDETVAKVSASGLVTAVGEGEATITATASNGVSDSCVITVPHEHYLVHFDALDADCVTKGNIEYWKCTSCNKMYVSADADESDEVSSVVIAVDADKHTGEIKYVGSIAPTTTAEGYTGDVYCASCGIKLGDGEKVDKLPHVHSMTEHKAVAATCTVKGTAAYWTCSECGNVYYADADGCAVLENIVLPINPNNHTGETETEGKITAACTSKGYTGDKVYSCCGAVYEYGSATPALGHDESGEWYDNGTEHYQVCEICYTKINTAEHSGGVAVCAHQASCSTCGMPYGDTPKHQLTYVAAKDPACTSQGITAHWLCSGCRGLFADADAQTSVTLAGVTIAAAGHRWGAWEITNSATAEAEGSAVRECTVCDTEETRTVAKITVDVSDTASDAQQVNVNVFKDDEASDIEVQIDESHLNDTLENLGNADPNAQSGAVTINVAAAAEQDEAIEEINKVTIPATSVVKIADAAADDENATDALQIKLSSGSVEFDADALASIKEQVTDASGETTAPTGVSLKIESTAAKDAASDEVVEALSEAMNVDQVNVLNEMHSSDGVEIVAAVDLTLVNAATNEPIGSSAGSYDTAGFGGGEVTVSFPFEPKAGHDTDKYAVIYIYDDGTTETIDAVYDAETGCLVFKVTHFSTYIITYASESESDITYGDVNGDGTVDADDSDLLAKYFAGWDVEIDKAAADVNADGTLNRRDAMILARYLDGWSGYELAGVKD